MNCDNEIKVSVCCAVYNHEKYLRQCLNGFIMQKTNFKYEVLIHDDASTDHSPDIIREYEQKYPDIIKPIYQTENQYSKGKKISWEYQFPRAQGKYIALCEGDDYWCDENKLQKQCDALEQNDTAVFCAHDVICIWEDGKCVEQKYPQHEINNICISSEQMMDIMVKNNSYPFQTSSYFFRRNLIVDVLDNIPIFIKVAGVGDVPLLLYFITKGNFIYIKNEMSCYRMMSQGSWSSRINNLQRRIENMKIGIASYVLFDVFSGGIYTNQIEKLIETQQYHIYQYNEDFKKINNKRFKWLLKEESNNQRLFYIFCAYFPWFKKLYQWFKGN